MTRSLLLLHTGVFLMKSEWRDRLSYTIDALKRDFYHALGNIDFDGYVTNKEYKFNEALSHPRKPMPEGTVWGKPFEHAWLFASIIMPDEAGGKRIVLNLDAGCESTIFVNGKVFGTRRSNWVDMPHHFIVDQTISYKAKPGESFEIVIEAYAGHHMTDGHPTNAFATGPVFPEFKPINENELIANIGKNTFGIWNEDAYQLYLDIVMLKEIAQNLDDNNFRREKIEKALQKLLVDMDMEQPYDIRTKIYRQYRDFLAPYMNAQNGSSSPLVYAIGNSHLDVAWLWTLSQTRRKTARTFSQQIRHMKEYPEYKYLQSQAVLYDMCNSFYPELFHEIKEMINKGQWYADGAMWVEPDTNMSSGEALIRQFIYGKRYFKENFDVDSRLCWLPDTFGYTGALPQILKGCDIDYLTTQKIFWTYNEADRFPYHAFTWQGIDGSKVLCYLHLDYASKTNANELIHRWNSRVEKDGTGLFMLPFGYGDGGGGATRDDIENVRREANIEGAPRMIYAHPVKLFEDLKEYDVYNRKYVGELYFQCHRGTYTTQAKIKRGNRKSEIAMQTLETWSALSAYLGKSNYPYTEIERLWKNVLLNQFHDILPGSSIREVNQEAEKLYCRTLHDAKKLQSKALSTFTSADGISIFNNLCFARCELVELDNSFINGAIDSFNNDIYCETINGKVYALVNVPAMGNISLKPKLVTKATKKVFINQNAETISLENEFINATFSDSGELIDLIYKLSGDRFINNVGNKFHIYRDIPRKFDAWDIDSMTELCEVPLSENAKLSVEYDGMDVCILKLEKDILSSNISQRIILRSGESRLDFETIVDWHELHKLLKVSFASTVQCDEAINQVQFGYIKRPTHRSRPYDADRFEVCNHYYTALCDEGRGAAILNDCKYGVSMLDDTISLTLLRAGAHPEMRTDQGIHTFTYSYYVWEGNFASSDVVKESYRLNVPMSIVKGSLEPNNYLSVDKDNIIVESMKLAEDGSGDIIMRVYESKRAKTNVHIKLNIPFSNVYKCNMLEVIQDDLLTKNNTISTTLNPFEILTIRVRK